MQINQVTEPSGMNIAMTDDIFANFFQRQNHVNAYSIVVIGFTSLSLVAYSHSRSGDQTHVSFHHNPSAYIYKICTEFGIRLSRRW
jgi:hypothetical protein